MKGLFIVLCFVMVGCTEIVPTNFPVFEAIPTINSILVEGKPFFVKVSLTGGLDSMVLSNVDNASIELYVNQAYAEQLEYVDNGIYTSKTIIESGKEYQCKVFIPDFDTLFCIQCIPLPNPIINVEYLSSAGIDEYGDPYSSTIITFKNDPSKLQFYEIIIKRTNKSDSSDIPKYFIVNSIPTMPVITDPVLLNEGLSIALFANETIIDSIYTMTLHYSGCSSNSFLVELRSVSYEYYRYQKQYYLYNEGEYGDITTKTSAFPLFSNIENAYGIFAGYSVSISDTIRP